MAQDLLAEAESAMRVAIRYKFRVTLDERDYRQQNLDALDLLSAVRLKLLQRLRACPDQDHIKALPSYAATIAYNACSDLLRSRYPQRTRLRNRLRRVLERSPAHVLHSDRNGELQCQAVNWADNKPRAEPEQVLRLRMCPGDYLPEDFLSESLDEIPPAALLSLVDSILDYVDGVVSFDDLTSIACACLHVEDVPDESLPQSADDNHYSALKSREHGGYSLWLSTERMKLLWEALTQLLPWHRAAFLLNLREGDIGAFPYYGVASVEQIGSSLGFTIQQYTVLADQLMLDSHLRAQLSILSGPGQKFAVFWKYLPLDDNTVAAVLAVTRPQVIAYRSKAIERLRRMLKGAV